MTDREEFMADTLAKPPVTLHNAHGEVILTSGQLPAFVEATATGSRIAFPTDGYTILVDVTESPAEVFAAFRGAMVPPAPPSGVVPLRVRNPRAPKEF